MLTDAVFYLLNLLSPSNKIFTSCIFLFLSLEVLFGSFLLFPFLSPLSYFLLYIHKYILRAVLKYLSDDSIISHFRICFHWTIFLLVIAHIFFCFLKCLVIFCYLLWPVWILLSSFKECWVLSQLVVNIFVVQLDPFEASFNTSLGEVYDSFYSRASYSSPQVRHFLCFYWMAKGSTTSFLWLAGTCTSPSSLWAL